MKKTFAKTSIIIFILTIIVKIFGFVREIIVGYFGGTSSVTDAYNISTIIPNFFLVVVTQVILIAFIPTVSSIKEVSGHDRNDFTNKCIIVIFSLSAVFALIIGIFPKFLVNIFASGLNEHSKQLATIYLRICCSTVLFQSFTIVLSAYLNSIKKFIAPIIYGIILDIVTILFFYLYNKTNNELFIGFIQLANAVLKAVCIIVVAYKNGFRFRFQKKIFDKNIKSILLISLPALISVGVYEINVLVDKNFASYFDVGSISSLAYAQTINGVLYALIVNSIITIAYTELTEQCSSNNLIEAKELLKKTLKSILLITFPLTLVFSVFSKDIVTILFMHGKFDIHSVELTYRNLIFYVLGLPSLSVSLLLTRFLYANKNHYPAIIISTIGLASNIAFNIVSFKFTTFGPAGIAAATSFSSFIQMVLLIIYITKKYHFVKSDLIAQFMKPLIMMALLLPVLVMLTKIFGNVSNIYIRVPSTIILTFAIYIAALLFSEPQLLQLFKNRFPKNKTKK